MALLQEMASAQETVFPVGSRYSSSKPLGPRNCYPSSSLIQVEAGECIRHRVPPKAQSHPESLRLKNRFVVATLERPHAPRAAPKGQGPWLTP